MARMTLLRNKQRSWRKRSDLKLNVEEGDVLWEMPNDLLNLSLKTDFRDQCHQPNV